MTRLGLSFSALLLACGPTPASQPASGEGQSDGVTEPKLDVPDDGTSSSSSGGDGCTEVVEGDVEVNDTSDFEWLRTVREIRGALTIDGLTEQSNLDFLGCLEEVESIWIKDTQSLRSLEGLGRVERLESGLSVSGNTALETLRGLDAVEAIGQVWILDNPELSRLELDSPTEIGSFRLGWYECDGYGPDATAIPRGDNPKLSELDGFGEVTAVTGFTIEGQSAFSSTETIVEVLSRRKPGSGIPAIGFHLNPQLGGADVNAVFEALGLDDRFEPSPGIVCENRDDQNKCPCLGGE